jgi:hypothetical protein
MTLLEAIRSVLRPELIQEGAIELVEDAPQNRCSPVKLNKRGPALVLKLDAPRSGITSNDWLFPLFNHRQPALTCVCDYIVFCNATARDDARLFAFLCELKSGRPHHARQQIRNGRLLCDHLIAMAQHHQRVTTNPAIAYRGLVFTPAVKSPPKLTSKATPPRCEPDEHMNNLKFFPPFSCGITLQLEWLCA